MDFQQFTSIAADSRKLSPGSLFCAYPGLVSDGRDYIDQAIAGGASAICYDPAGGYVAPKTSVPCFAVEQLQQNLSFLAGEFYHHPSRQLTVIGVTGTNGKTSTSHFLAQMLVGLGYKCALIGSLGNGLLTDLQPTDHTTPDAITNQKLLAHFKAQGINYVVMEVSSHALKQGRVNAIAFDYAITTNVSHDHMDYHDSIADYLESKTKLIRLLGPKGVAIINADDSHAAAFTAAAADKKIVTYGHNGLLKLLPAQPGPNGLSLQWQESLQSHQVATAIIGKFNAYNILAAVSCCRQLEFSYQQLLPMVAKLHAVPGRMEVIASASGVQVIIDYAHTPDSLEQALQNSAPKHGKLWCVFGPGGERDRSKRPLMAQIAERLADQVVLTSDNPRREPIEQIFADTRAGFNCPEKVHCLVDRAEAIRYVLTKAKPCDIILLAGKGHERYQLVGSEHLVFDERKIIASFAPSYSR